MNDFTNRLRAEIIAVGNGRYTLSLGTYSLDADFFKIERLAEGSNYYLLWPDAQRDDFYLYNAKKQTYAFNRIFFKKTEYYSEDSLSFVAYRSDHNYAYMFYEDGYIDKEHVCGYIGEEYNGVRPIKTYGGRWLYYNVYMRKPLWKVEYGYKLKEGWSLGKKIDYNCFVVNRADGGMCIWRYNEKAHKIENHSSIYDSIECIDSSYLLCQKHRESLFELFLCRKFRCLSNPQWRTPNFLFKGNYIFYNSSPDVPANGSTGWQIFNTKDGKPALCLDWVNIRLYDLDGDFYMLVDTDTEKGKKVFLSDIEKSANDLKALSQSLYAQSKQEKTTDIHNEEGTNQTDIDESNEIEKKDEKRNAQPMRKEKQPFQCKNQLPSSIKYCTSIKTSERIRRGGYLQCNRKCTDVLHKEYICWIVPQNNRLIITQYIRRNTYKIVYYKTYDQTHFIDKGIELPTRIIPITLENAQEDTLIEQLEKALDIAAETKNNKVCTESVLQENHCVTESPKITDKQMQLSSQDKVCFTFSDKCYALNVDDVWEIENVFDKQKYLLKEEVLAILLTPENLVSIEYKQNVSPHYKIIGVGKDVRFDQDFGPINKAIRDNARKILLFKRDDDKIYLVDEVRCCGYTMETQTFHRKDKERKVILFDLVSLRRINEWYFKK